MHATDSPDRRNTPGLAPLRGPAYALVMLALLVFMSGCGGLTHEVRWDHGTTIQRTYVNEEYGFRLQVPPGWSVTSTPWYMRSTVVTFQGRDNATRGRARVFLFREKSNLSEWEKHEKMMASVTRQVYPLRETERKRIRTSWGEVLQVKYFQTVEADRYVYRIWFVTQDTLGIALVCETSDLLYELVNKEIESVFGSFRLLGPGAATEEMRAATESQQKNLHDALDSLRKEYTEIEGLLEVALTGDAPRTKVAGLNNDLSTMETNISAAERLLKAGQLGDCASRVKRLKEDVKKTEALALSLGYILHTVSYSGETLFRIAAWYTGDAENWREIRQFNDGLDPARLKIGSRIKVPLYLNLKTREPMERREKPRLRKKPRTEEQREEEEMEPVGPK